MIRNNTNSILKPFVGNYHPFNLYRGYTKIAGYTTETAREINAVELQNCYNEKLKAKVYGNSTQSILPVEYQQVEYLESTGTQYIDTGIKLKTTNKLEISFERIDSLEHFVFGSRISASSQGYTFNLQALNVRNNTFSSWSGGSTINGLDSTDNKKVALGNHIIKISSTGLLIDDVSYNCNVGTTDSTFNMYLFGLNENGYLETRRKPLRIHYCKIWDNDTLTHNFIPCIRNSDNVAGMYDTVNNVFYTNAGTGDFLAGADYPTPDASIEIISVGDLVTEGEHEGKYKITLQSEGLLTSELQTTTIYLDAPLRAIEVSSKDNYNVVSNGKYYIADYVDYGRQKVVRNIGEIVLNELLTYARYTTNITGQYRFGTNISNCYSTSSVIYYLGLISNKLKSICRQDGYACMEGISYLPETGYAGPGLMLYIDKCKTLTVEEFKTYLSTNPITVDYILATPIEEDIELEDINVIPNYCKVSVEVEQELLALEVEYAKMEVG